MSRNEKRVVWLIVAGVLLYWRFDRPEPPGAAGPNMQAYLAAPDMGIHCFDDHGQLVGWQWVNLDDAQRSCGISRERLMELKSTDWKTQAANKRENDFSLAALGAGIGYFVLGVLLLRYAFRSGKRAREMGKAADARTAREFWIRRRNSDRLWLAAWVLPLAALFVAPAAWREDIIIDAGGLMGWSIVVVVIGLPFYAVVRWLQGRKEEQEEKVAAAQRRDTSPRMTTGRAVTSENEKKALGMKGQKLKDL